MPDSGATPHPFVRPVRAGAVSLVSPVELKQLVAAHEPPVVVDVRPERERLLARIENDRHIPLAELPRRYGELPSGRPVVVYDQFGANARRAAEYLVRKGHHRTAALEGGIDEYARIVDPTIPRYSAEDDPEHVTIRQFPRPETGCLAYLATDPETRSAVVIDPGHEVAPYLAALSAGQLTLRAIVETHTHADHLAGHAALHERTGAPIYVGHRSPAQYPHLGLHEPDSLEFGRGVIHVLETPGHTRDHLTLRLDRSIFTGDTLLIGGCGRTDLGDGDPELLWSSLNDKILALPEETEVLPAHFGPRHALVDRYASSLGFERATNEALNQGSRASFLRYMTEGWPPKPTNFDAIVRANLDA
ncbi:MAG TPA: MBL fold metallo-hydrolase [Thermoplasmata archaeon]|nr:MBL fold metallo-hydrolase [Thermoplasmata archaeon]